MFTTLRRTLTAGTVATLLLAWAVPAAAQTPMPSMAVAPGPPASALISVATCHPERAMRRVTGFAPAYYPGGLFAPYIWNDPYGFSYSQATLAPSDGTLTIDYTNISTRVMKTIDFGLVANGRVVAEVRDVGTFSPKAEIKHQFGLDPNVFPLQTALSQCVPLRVAFADGTTWKNPHLPRAHSRLHKHHH